MSENILGGTINHETCSAVGYQAASVCVPVTVTPFARPGRTVTRCCGGPVIAPGRQTCCGTKNGFSSFTITQDIRVAVPVEFGAVSDVGDPFVDSSSAFAESISGCCELDEDAVFMQHLSRLEDE